MFRCLLLYIFLNLQLLFSHDTLRDSPCFLSLMKKFWFWLFKWTNKTGVRHSLYWKSPTQFATLLNHTTQPPTQFFFPTHSVTYSFLLFEWDIHNILAICHYTYEACTNKNVELSFSWIIHSNIAHSRCNEEEYLKT